jgi:hypothetical protein
VGEQVLGYLSTYSSLGEDTALAVLSDEILRNEVRQAGPKADIEPLIDSAIVRENAALHDANESLRTTLSARDQSLREAQRTSGELARGLEERIRTQDERIAALEAGPADGQEQVHHQLDRVTRERDDARGDLASLTRKIKIGVVVAAAALWLALVWGGPALAPSLPVLHEISEHARRLGIQIVATAALPLLLIALLDKDRRLLWLAVLAVFEPLLIALAALL